MSSYRRVTSTTEGVDTACKVSMTAECVNERLWRQVGLCLLQRTVPAFKGQCCALSRIRVGRKSSVACSPVFSGNHLSLFFKSAGILLDGSRTANNHLGCFSIRS